MNNLSKTLSIIGVAAFVAASLCVSYRIGHGKGEKSALRAYREQTDTLYIRDTLRVVEPCFVRERVTDTLVRVEYVRETIHDTVTVFLPRVWRTYEGENYTAQVSGIDPVLESLEIRQNSTIITPPPVIRARPKRWGLGVQVGGGITYTGGQFKTVPYVGIGISYNLLVW